MTIRLLLGMESGSTTHPPGAILNLSPALEADLVSTNRATWVTQPSLPSNAGVPVMATTGPGGGGGITNILSLTQAQYDAIVTKDAATLYVIVEG